MPTISTARSPGCRGESGRAAGEGGAYPLVAISPDGKTVAVARSARHAGEALLGARRHAAQEKDRGRAPTDERRSRDRAAGRALGTGPGPNNLLATAGNTAGRGGDPNLGSRLAFLPDQSEPPAQSYTRMMRFSPQGNLLAIMGSGPIELWDPVALNLVAVLVMSDQATDVAFAARRQDVGRRRPSGQGDALDSARFGGANSTERVRHLAGVAGVQRRRRSRRRRLERRDLVVAQRPLPGDRVARSPLSAGSASASMTSAAVEPKRPENRRPRRPAAAGLAHAAGKGRGAARTGLRRRWRSTHPAEWFCTTCRACACTTRAQSLPKARPRSGSPSRRRRARRWRMPDDGQDTRRSDPWHSFARRASISGTLKLPTSSCPSNCRHGRRAEPPQELEIAGKHQGSGELQGPVFRSIQISPRRRSDLHDRADQGSPSVASRSGRSTLERSSPRPLEPVSLQASMSAASDGVISFGASARRQAAGRRPTEPVRSTLLDADKLVVVGQLRAPARSQKPSCRTALAFSPDGTELAVGSQQGTISLWSIAKPDATASSLASARPPRHGQPTWSTTPGPPAGQRNLRSHRRSLGPRNHRRELMRLELAD